MLTIDQILADVKEEILRSNELHQQAFHSNQEWLGTLREEYKELENEIFKSKEVWAGNDRMKKEAIQVAAMAIKGILSLC